MKTLKIDHHIKADVLIIGGGFSGLWAAISAREHVENVVLVDKGPADWGGLGTSSGGRLPVRAGHHSGSRPRRCGLLP